MKPTEPTAECDWALRELFEQPAHPSPRLQAHLDRCPRCRQAQAFDQRLAAQHPTLSMPANLEVRVRQLQRRRQRVQRAAWGMAAAALIGTIGLALWPVSRIPSVASPTGVAVATQPVVAEPADLEQLLAAAFAPAPVVDVTPQDRRVRGVVSKTFLGGRE
ncbi:MAG: hypothetical protein JNM56_38660 [Planctomycetia bacterium]|nr:hypothetical protein [Planctomycetia bacterium]